MKLRFHADTLRLRLSQTEVTRLVEHGCVDESVAFPGGPKLSYSIKLAPNSGAISDGPAAAEMTATFDGESIAIQVPQALAMSWIESDRAGMESRNGPLTILVEKDFQCLHRAIDENPDSFPNPLAEKD